MTGPKTNERPGTKAVLRHAQISPYKVRPVLDLIRGEHVEHAMEILQFSERDAATPIRKLLVSAIANASNNDGIDPDELFVAACFADEGPSLRRFRYRARGRPGRVMKRRSHITIVVSRLEADELARHRERRAAEQAALRARRVEAGRRGRRRRTEEPSDEQAEEVAEETADETAEESAEAAEVAELAEAAEETREEETTQEEAVEEAAEASVEVAEEPAEATTETPEDDKEEKD